MDYDEFLKTLEGNDPKHKSRAGNTNANAGTTQTTSSQNASYGQQSAAYGQQTASNSYGGTQYNSAQTASYGQQTAGAQTNTYTGESYYEVRDRLKSSSGFRSDDENMVMGIVGALIGAMLGIGVWCLIGMAGYIAWIGSLALIGGAYFGYILMAKGIGTKGLIAVAAIVLLSVYVGTRLSFSITLNRELNKVKDEYELEDSDIPSVSKIFFNAGDYIEQLDVKKDYNSNMAMGYVFTIAAAGTIVFRRQKSRL